MMSTERALMPLALLAVTLGLLVAACGEGDTDTSGTSGSSQSASGNGADRAFAGSMIPHHRSAVEMAEVAKEESGRGKITELADAIISTQTAEIEQLTAVDQRLEDAGVEPGDLGVAEHEMGMNDDASMLAGAEAFDREFIDMMIAHHQGAIRMARAALEQGQDQELRDLAAAIEDAQADEIDEMNTWRVEWYGSLSPAGGVPPEDDGGGGDHGGHGE